MPQPQPMLGPCIGSGSQCPDARAERKRKSSPTGTCEATRNTGTGLEPAASDGRGALACAVCGAACSFQELVTRLAAEFERVECENERLKQMLQGGGKHHADLPRHADGTKNHFANKRMGGAPVVMMPAVSEAANHRAGGKDLDAPTRNARISETMKGSRRQSSEDRAVQIREPWDSDVPAEGAADRASLRAHPPAMLPTLSHSSTGRMLLDSERNEGGNLAGRGGPTPTDQDDSRGSIVHLFSQDQLQRSTLGSEEFVSKVTSAAPNGILVNRSDGANEFDTVQSAAANGTPHGATLTEAVVKAMENPQLNQRRVSIDSVYSDISGLSLQDVWKEKNNVAMARLRPSAVSAAGGNLMGSAEPVGPTQTQAMHTKNSVNPYQKIDGTEVIRAGDKLTCLDDPKATRIELLMQRLVLEPSDIRGLLWDILTVVFLLYDLIMIPLQASIFADYVNGGTKFMDVMSALVWTFDICISFCRGYEQVGTIDMRPNRIARRYLITWLVPDVSIVLLDWSLLFTEGNGDIEVLKNLRIRRIIRILRIIRLVRVAKIANKETLRDMFHKERHQAILAILKLLVIIWVINHYAACGWYLLGTMADIDERSWLRKNLVAEEIHDDKHYAYWTAFHWSITQFTPASMEVMPTNTFERVYCVGTIFAGLIIFSSFVSQMTQTVTHFKQLSTQQKRDHLSMRKYLSQHRVPVELMKDCLAAMKSSKKAQEKCLHEKDVPGLNFMPDNLLWALHQEVYAPAIQHHPLFARLQDLESVGFGSICNLAMTEKSLLVGEELFRCGSKGKSMFFVNSGNLSYFFGQDTQVPLPVAPREWFCEATLWLKWRHRGRMTTESMVTAELMVLNAQEFHNVIAKTRSAVEVHRYARIFTNRAAQECGGPEWVSDVWGKSETVGRVAKKAWNIADDAALHKALMLWDHGGNKWCTVFTAWKKLTEASRADRKKSMTLQKRLMKRWGTKDVGASLASSPAKKKNMFARGFSRLSRESM